MIVAIFGKKTKKHEVRKCSMCGAAPIPGERHSHIVKISLTEPPWLPERLRAQAQGEYTFRCDRCNSFPGIKWPAPGGADSGMWIHLAAAHYAGMLAHMDTMVIRQMVNFDMIRID
jgi:hypothetical protein